MERYNDYKDSGVQWLGEIPSHWETRTLKYCCSLKGRIGWNGLRSEEFQDTSFAYLVTGQDFIGSEIDWSKCYQISKERYEEDPYIQLNNGDMLITKDGTIGKVAKVTKLDKPACLNSGIFVIKQKGSYFNQGFLYWMLCSNVLKEFNVYTQTGATIAHLYQNVFENMPCLLPPISEQQTISDYLDTATAKIDAAIAQQQKMIELLNERKQIIINNAVTKGLNPDAPMKDSGVDWIGEIPEHWEMKRLKTILSVKDKRNVDPEALLLSVYTAIGVRPRQELEERGNKASTVINYKIVSKGDLIVNRLLAWMGAYGLSNYDGVTSPDYDVYSFHADVNRGYYETLFRNTQFKSDCYKYGHGIMMMRWRTYSDEFLSINVPIPPRQEQDAIFDYLKPQIDKIEEGIEQCNRMVTLLQERKQIIINDVVTGKVKVC